MPARASITGLTTLRDNRAEAARERAAIAARRETLVAEIAPFREALETLAAPDVDVYERAVREVRVDHALADVVARELARWTADEAAAFNTALGRLIADEVLAAAEIATNPHVTDAHRAYITTTLARHRFTATLLPQEGYQAIAAAPPTSDDVGAYLRGEAAPTESFLTTLVRAAVVNAIDLATLVQRVLDALRCVAWADDEDAYARISMLTYVLAAAQLLAAVDAALAALDAYTVADTAPAPLVLQRVHNEPPTRVPVRVTLDERVATSTYTITRIFQGNALASVDVPPDTNVVDLTLDVERAGEYVITVTETTADGTVTTTLAKACCRARVTAHCVRHNGTFEMGTPRVPGECLWRAHPLNRAETAFRASPAFAAARSVFNYTAALEVPYDQVKDRFHGTEAELYALSMIPAATVRARYHTFASLLADTRARERLTPTVSVNATLALVTDAMLARYSSTLRETRAALRHRIAAAASNDITELPIIVLAAAMLATPGGVHASVRTFINSVLRRIEVAALERPEPVFWTIVDMERALGADALVNLAAERRLAERVAAIARAYDATGRTPTDVVWSGVHSSTNEQPDAYAPGAPPTRGSVRIGLRTDAGDVHAYVETAAYSPDACRLANAIFRFVAPSAPRIAVPALAAARRV